MNRTEFAERIGFILVFGHIFLAVEIVLIAFISGQQQIMTLLSVCIPVTAALAGPTFAWFTEQLEQTPKLSRRKVRRMQVVVIGGVTALFFLLAGIVPIVWMLATEQANEDLFLGIFAAIESAFGAMLAAVVRTLFKRDADSAGNKA